MTIHKDKISAIILAGGQASRFQYRDKGLLHWQGKPLIAHVIAQLEQQVSNIFISCNRNIEQYESYHYPCIKDQIMGFQGPLAGIHSGLNSIETPYCFVCPCDCPELPFDIVARLFAAINDHKADLGYVFDGERKQYLLSLMKSDVKCSLDDYLKSNDRRVRMWHNTLKTIEVNFSDCQQAFQNINSPEQLKADD